MPLILGPKALAREAENNPFGMIKIVTTRIKKNIDGKIFLESQMIRQSYSSLKQLETNSEQYLTVKKSNILN